MESGWRSEAVRMLRGMVGEARIRAEYKGLLQPLLIVRGGNTPLQKLVEEQKLVDKQRRRETWEKKCQLGSKGHPNWRSG